MNYGAIIKKIRESKGIKAIFVAKKLGLSAAGYSGIERGRAKLTVERAAEIAEILGVPITKIFFDDDISETRSAKVG